MDDWKNGTMNLSCAPSCMEPKENVKNIYKLLSTSLTGSKLTQVNIYEI